MVGLKRPCSRLLGQVFLSVSLVVLVVTGDALADDEFTTLSIPADSPCFRSDNATPCGDGRVSKGGYSAISAGLRHTCGLHTNGALSCVGLNDEGQASPPKGKYSAVEVGRAWSHSCALDAKGAITCWGDNSRRQLEAPEGKFSKLALGAMYGCAIEKKGGALRCWGAGSSGQASPPTGSFVDVSCGAVHTCALRKNGNLVCWGNNDRGQASPPKGKFTQVVVGYEYSCGLDPKGLVQCWGDEGISAKQPWSYVETRKELSPSIGKLKFEVSDYDIPMEKVWVTSGSKEVEEHRIRESFESISAGAFSFCGVTTSNGLRCWGKGSTKTGETLLTGVNGLELPKGPKSKRRGKGTPGDFYNRTSPFGPYNLSKKARKTYDQHQKAAAAKRKDAAKKYGNSAPGQEVTTGPDYKAVSVGGNHACALLATGSPMCWGSDAYGRMALPATQPMAELAEGDYGGCAINSAGELVCWQMPYKADGRLFVPSKGKYTKVETLSNYGCGLTKKGVLQCWGGGTDKKNGPANHPPKGKYVDFSLAKTYGCAVEKSGSLRCWTSGAPEVKKGKVVGKKFSRELVAPPKGKFTQVAVVREFACALDKKGKATCWAPELEKKKRRRDKGGTGTAFLSSEEGGPGLRVTKVPDVSFSKVQARYPSACGLTKKGVVQCWGRHELVLKGPFVDMTMSAKGGRSASLTVCAVLKGGEVECTSSRELKRSDLPPAGRYKSVRLYGEGAYKGCGINESDTPVCWPLSKLTTSLP